MSLELVECARVGAQSLQRAAKDLNMFTIIYESLHFTST